MDYFCNDDSTASDNLSFLLEFFKKAPKYASLPFYVFGESYAGVYVPTLAAKIVKSNQAGANAKINLVGTGSGNPVTNTPSEGTLQSWVPLYVLLLSLLVLLLSHYVFPLKQSMWQRC